MDESPPLNTFPDCSTTTHQDLQARNCPTGKPWKAMTICAGRRQHLLALPRNTRCDLGLGRVVPVMQAADTDHAMQAASKYKPAHLHKTLSVARRASAVRTVQPPG